MDELSDPTPVLEVAIGILMLVAVILIHGFSLRVINRRFSRGWSRVTTGTSHWRIDLLMASTVGSLAALHMLETLLIAIPLSLSGIVPELRDSYYYVLESYTTLGEANMRLPEAWRLLGPIIAMSGLFTFGWTGSVLVSIMTQFGRFDRAQADQALKDERAGDGAEPETER